jgi:hypothetical protein
MTRARLLLTLVLALCLCLPAASALAKRPGGGGGGSIGLIAPWGNAAYSGGKISVTYSITAASSVPQSAVNAVQAGVDQWNSCFGGSTTFNETIGGTNFSTSDPGCRLSFNGDWRFVRAAAGTTPQVKISIKKGGGNIAGQTFFSADSSGFLNGARVQISGSAFGLANDAHTIWNTSTHELGHVTGLDHSNVSTDLMYPVLNGNVAIGSCEHNGLEALYGSWLPHGLPPALPTQSSVAC